MKLYLVNAENIYFQQIKNYFREIISSYDNGNYRSAAVMLYSTIICDLLLKLKELSEVYSDNKAEEILNEINKQRKEANNSSWEWNLIKKIRSQTELLNDESYTMLEHIYDLRNFSAHPALNEDYELISPTPEMTVAYIKKALDDILTKPSVFAQNIVDRMSNDIAAKKEIYYNDIEAFNIYLNKVYFQRMSEKMINQVFKAFWKFTFIKIDEEIYTKNRYINRKTLEAMLDEHCDYICKYIGENTSYFTVSQDIKCLLHVCILLAYFPQVYVQLELSTKHQIDCFNEKDIGIIKWFVADNLEQHVSTFTSDTNKLPKKLLDILNIICKAQGQPELFTKFLINHYAKSDSYSDARDRFDGVISTYLDLFNSNDFIELIDTINSNRQIYDYGWQRARNDMILQYAIPKLPANFDLDRYEHFEYTKQDDAVGQEEQKEQEELVFEINSENDNDDEDELPF